MLGALAVVWLLALLPPFAGRAAAGEFAADFEQARQLAFDGRRQEARRAARALLEREPDNADVEVLLARLDAWDGRYVAAAVALEGIIRRHPEHVDARLALADVELWRGDFAAARRACEAALSLDPNNAEVPPRLAKIEARREARAAPTRAVLPGGRRGDRARLAWELSDFDQDFATWQQITASFERRASWGTLIGRVHYFNRFTDGAAQFDVEGYRDLNDDSYVNLAATVATSSILPGFSTLFEYYHALPRALEASLGFRLIGFDSLTKVYAGSLGIYRGKYWAAVRPSVSSNKLGTTVSWSAKIRRYFFDQEEYATFTLARGKELEGISASLDLFELDTNTATLEWRKRIAPHYVVSGLLGYELQELPRRDNRSKLTLGIGVEYLF